MGLRRRVSVGFFGIVGVLILSGMVSFYELNALSMSTDKILSLNREYQGLSDQMFSTLREQNLSLVQIVAFDDHSYEQVAMDMTTRLDSILIVAREGSIVPDMLDTLLYCTAQMRGVIEELLSPPPPYVEIEEIVPVELIKVDSIGVDSLAHLLLPTMQSAPATPDVPVVPLSTRDLYREYTTLYEKMADGFDRYQIASQSSLAPRAEQLQNSAYRAVTPVLISLTVMIVIVLMLFYFVMSYCVAPVVKMNSALKGWLAYKIPFAPKGECRDEMSELREGIDSLVKQSVKSIKE